MRLLALTLVPFCFSILAQSSGENQPTNQRLQSALVNLGAVPADKQLLTRQLVAAMVAIPESNRKPTRPVIEVFASDFVDAFAGRTLTSLQASSVARPLVSVLQGATTNLNSASRFRDSLVALRLESFRIQGLTKRFIAIGEEIRGPDDSPVLGDK